MANENINLFDAEQQPQQSYIVGTVARTFLESPDSFYKVLLVKVSATNLNWHGDEIVVTGNFADVEEMPYRFFGKLVDHPKYVARISS